MSTTKGIWRWALASAAMAITSSAALAGVINAPPSVTTNTSAGLVIFPKIKVDGSGVDTLVQLTNTSGFLTRALCFWVNANGHCSNAPSTVCDQVNFREQCPTGGVCTQGWQEIDFHMTLTKRQPISWSASSGRSEFPLPAQLGEDPSAQSNKNSHIPPVPEVPFTGELRCIQVDVSSELPLDANDLKGEATIVRTDDTYVDVSKYNAIGVPAIEGLPAPASSDAQSATLNIGGPNANYNACPNVLTINHFFDGASIDSAGVTSDLTLVPCGADFLNQTAPVTTIQFLIFNEFEQRFSTSTKMDCYKEVQLSDIDTRPGNLTNENSASIFAAGVQGTLTGQSRLRAVAGSGDYAANGVLAVLEEKWDSEAGPGEYSSAAVNVQYSGTRSQGDQIVIPLP